MKDKKYKTDYMKVKLFTQLWDPCEWPKHL